MKAIRRVIEIVCEIVRWLSEPPDEDEIHFP